MQQELISLLGTKYRFVSDRYYTPPGKFSVTFKGEDEQGRPVLLKKIISGEVNHEVTMPVRHPSLVAVHDIIRHGTGIYLVQAFMPGKNLRELAAHQRLRRTLSETELAAVFIQVINGLEALHEGGWLHGDVKPGNIIVQSGTQPVAAALVDFGKASPIGLTENGNAGFSLVYSAPEVVLKETAMIGPSADFYALGITLYELIEGRPAFHHPNPELLLHLMINQPLPAPRYIPAALLAVIRRMTFRAVFPRPPHLMDPAERREMLGAAIRERYDSAAALREDLSKALLDFHWPRPWWKRLVR